MHIVCEKILYGNVGGLVHQTVAAGPAGSVPTAL